MSSVWKTVVLSEIVSKLGDGLHGTPKYSENGDYHFINGNNLVNGRIVFNEKTKRVDETQYSKFKKDLNNRTLLVSINGTIGNIAYYRGEKVVLGKSACYFNLNDNINKHFVRYVLDSRSFQMYIESQATGTTIKNVSLKTMRNFEFKLPPIEEQKAIAHILGTLDDKIEINRKMNETLEQMAQALFKSWFVDFDPVLDNAIAKGNSIPEALKLKAERRKEVISSGKYKALPKELMELFPSSFLFNEELDKWIPEGWHIGKMEEVVNVKYGKDHKKLEEGDYPCYGSGGIMRYVDSTLCNEESVLIPRKGTLSNIMYVRNPFWSVDTMFFTEFKQPNYVKYLFYFLQKFNFTEMNVGSAVPSMTTKVLNSLNLLQPSEQVLQLFDEKVEHFLSKKEANDKQNEFLVRQRGVLLPQLISGKLRVKEYYRSIEKEII